MTQWGLDVLFNPAKRHMDEEKQRLQSTREEVGDASKGSRIDLSSGKVTIRRKPAEDEPAVDEADAVEGDAAEGDAVEGDAVEGDEEAEEADAPAEPGQADGGG